MKKSVLFLALSLLLVAPINTALAYDIFGRGTSPARPWYFEIVPSYLDLMRSAPLSLYNVFQSWRPQVSQQNGAYLMAQQAKTQMETQAAWDRLNATIAKPTVQIRQPQPAPTYIVVPSQVAAPVVTQTPPPPTSFTQQDVINIQSVINQVKVGTDSTPNCDATHCWGSAGGGGM
ncbi:hypothetical protein HY969_03865 [Candidatus Kaiserbacteria bacterium]|nr:hypothetical protein [Candidatus Kaiserbacteria bacterium]